MKLINIRNLENKIVDYFGIALTVPSNTTCIACDKPENGIAEIHAFIDNPKSVIPLNDIWLSNRHKSDPVMYIGSVNLISIAWYNSKVTYEK